METSYETPVELRGKGYILVLYIQNSILESVSWCTDSAQAEARFTELLENHYPEFHLCTKDDVETFLTDGYFDWSDNSLCIHHI